MDNINKDNLVKFISYFIIVFLLSLVLYLMYIDFLSETFFPKTETFSDVNITNKLKFIDSIDNKVIPTKLTTKTNIEHLADNNADLLIYDKNAPFVLKKDLTSRDTQSGVTNAVCSINDIVIKDNNNKTKCKINQNNLYLSTSGSNKFSIKVLSDGMYTTPDSNNYSYYDYDVKISDIGNQDLGVLRRSYFYFPDKNVLSVYDNNPRIFSHTNKYEMGILNYFNNYAKYNNAVDLTVYNELIIQPIENSSSTNNNLGLIKTYFTYLRDMLLLSNSDSTSPFIYNSGYNFDINDVKLKLINMYMVLVLNNDTGIEINMEINDSTNIEFYYDNPNNMNVYTLELKPSVIITFTNISLIYDNIPNNITQGSIWSLYYLKQMTPNITSSSLYSYTDTINYPIALSLATPNTTKDWENNKTNGVINYFQYIFKQGPLDNINIRDIINNNVSIIGTPGDQVVIQNLTKFIKTLGNMNLRSITDIFMLYEPNKSVGQAWAITNLIDNTTQEPIIAPLLHFDLIYAPSYCSNKSDMFFDNKCIPPCPTGFGYDFGLICLNSNTSNYLPGTSMCNYINSLTLPTPIDPIISAIKMGCDNTYFTKNKIVRQSDITGNLFTLPKDTTTARNNSNE